MIAGISLVACTAEWQPTGCPAVEPECGNVCCPDSTHYVCETNQCRLVACDSGYTFCNGSCYPGYGECCSGGFCLAELCGSNNTCRPVGSSDCSNGRYCPFNGGVCCNSGTACCF